MNFKIHFTLLILFLCSCVLKAQEESLWYSGAPSTEFHLNVTNTLTAIFNSQGNQSNVDPYQFTIKYGNKHAFKISAAVNIQNRVSDGNVNFLDVKESRFRTRIGYERRAVMARKFALYYGIDVAVNYFNERSEAGFLSSSSFVIKDRTFQYGLGPALGIMYHINKNISVSTEAFAYFFLTNRKRSEPNPLGGNDVVLNENGSSLQPVVPSSLYLCFKF